MPGHLGRRPPTDWRHVESYPLSAAPALPAVATPVVLGVDWHSRFDRPQRDSAGRYWAAKPGDDLGAIRGGHAICVKPGGLLDSTGWWDYHDQGSEGTCVGFSLSRMMTLMNRRRYVPTWLYDQATLIDEWPSNDLVRDAGTSVRAGCEVLRMQGHERPRHALPELTEGIDTYRWATSVDEIHQVLASPLSDRLGAVCLLNSWGRFYPHYTWLPDEVLDTLLRDDGEAVVVTDR